MNWGLAQVLEELSEEELTVNTTEYEEEDFVFNWGDDRGTASFIYQTPAPCHKQPVGPVERLPSPARDCAKGDALSLRAHLAKLNRKNKPVLRVVGVIDTTEHWVPSAELRCEECRAPGAHALRIKRYKQDPTYMRFCDWCKSQFGAHDVVYAIYKDGTVDLCYRMGNEIKHEKL